MLLLESSERASRKREGCPAIAAYRPRSGALLQGLPVSSLLFDVKQLMRRLAWNPNREHVWKAQANLIAEAKSGNLKELNK